MQYGKRHDFPFGIMDVAGILHLNIRRRIPGQAYADCPICGDRRGKMNLNLEKDTWRCNYCGEGGGMLSLYAKIHGVSNSDAYREICDTLAVDGFAPEHTVQPKDEPSAVPQVQMASRQEIHQTLSMLLSMLPLSPAHREHLRTARGLSDEQIEQFRLKSTPSSSLCRPLTNRLMRAGCKVEGVPGFYVDDYGRWTVKFYTRTSGIIIPIFGVDGLICGIQVRLDRPIKNKDDPPEKSGTKYLTLSTAGKNMGTSSGSPVHFVGDPCSRVVYVTEGCLKANVAHALSGRTFAAVLGANNVSGLDDLFAFLQKNGTQEIIEAQDMDKFSNQMTERGSTKIGMLARKHGLECRRLTWNPNCKGIDDWLLALRRKQHEERKNTDMNFKQQYLAGMCDLKHIEVCVEIWHTLPSDGSSLREYLGLTEEEYSVFLCSGAGSPFQELLDSQRRRQRFRIYQLDLVATCPFAFCGIDMMHKAGYQQPPAAEYCMIHDGELFCPVREEPMVTLERIFARYNDDLPTGYHGRSVSPSDVLELYEDGKRTYFYCDRSGFVPVKFSPALVKKSRITP